MARRIPDDCVSVIANRARIGEIDWDDKENFMYSEKGFAAFSPCMDSTDCDILCWTNIGADVADANITEVINGNG